MKREHLQQTVLGKLGIYMKNNKVRSGSIILTIVCSTSINETCKTKIPRRKHCATVVGYDFSVMTPIEEK